MVTAYIAATSDSWYCKYNGSTNYGNGSGDRLQVGYTVDGGGNTGKNRVGISFAVSPKVSGRTFSEVLLRLKVRNSAGGTCWGKGGNPQFMVRLVSPAFTVTENGQSGECTVSSAGGADTRGDGPAVVSTNEVEWDDVAAYNDVITVDITAMYNAWYTARGAGTTDYFSVRLDAVDETEAAHRIAFSSKHVTGAISAGGSGPDLKTTYDDSTTPSAPSIGMLPMGRVTGATTVTYDFDFTDTTAGECSQCDINVRTSAAVDGAGKLNAGTLLWNSGLVTPTSATSGRVTKTHGGTTHTRGQDYYWQARVKNAAGNTSAWSEPVFMETNTLPSATSRDPG
jgi:hypothetical protein